MPGKQLHTVDDLLHDPDFISYCERPTVELETHWNNWLQQNPQHVNLWEEAKQLYLLIKQEQSIPVSPALRQRTLNHILAAIEAPQPEVDAVKRRYYAVLKYAAAALMILIAGYWILDTTGSKNQTPVQLVKADVMREVNLPDGSKVTLNKGAVMRYAEKDGVRQLAIQGVAYIQVAKQVINKGETRPFIVELDGMQVQVLGTAFNVSNISGQKNVVLMQGKVKVETDGKAMIMQPGEKVVLKHKQLVKQTVNPRLYNAWMTENLVLNNTSLAEMIAWLEDAKGYQVENKLKTFETQKKISGNLSLEQDEALFKTLESVFNIQIIRDQQKLLIKSVTN